MSVNRFLIFTVLVLTEDQTNVLQKALSTASRDTVLVNDYRLSVTLREMITLCGTNWLSDMVCTSLLVLRWCLYVGSG